MLEFWELTPYEFNLVLDGYIERRQREEEAMITQAYLISRWVWAKKLDIEEILNKPKEEKQMSDDAMMKMCIELNKLYGGEEVNKDGN